MCDEIKESAKAAKEMAKTLNNALDKGDKFFRFLGIVLKDGLGIVSDKLEFMRWERKVRFVDKVNEINKIRKIENKIQYVAPKLAIPIFENALMEENDNLQDLWIKLLSSCQDKSKNVINRTAFIDILKQLESIDALFLNNLYVSLIESNRNYKIIFFSKRNICRYLKISDSEYDNICDNLMRLRLIKSHIEVVKESRIGIYNNTIDKGYEEVCLTSLGLNFIKCCIID